MADLVKNAEDIKDMADLGGTISTKQQNIAELAKLQSLQSEPSAVALRTAPADGSPRYSTCCIVRRLDRVVQSLGGICSSKSISKAAVKSEDGKTRLLLTRDTIAYVLYSSRNSRNSCGWS